MNTVHEIKPYTHKEIGDIYGISGKTLTNWLKPFAKLIGEKRGWYYNVAQVQTIFAKLGIPTTIKDAE